MVSCREYVDNKNHTEDVYFRQKNSGSNTATPFCFLTKIPGTDQHNSSFPSHVTRAVSQKFEHLQIITLLPHSHYSPDHVWRIFSRTGNSITRRKQKTESKVFCLTCNPAEWYRCGIMATLDRWQRTKQGSEWLVPRWIMVVCKVRTKFFIHNGTNFCLTLVS